MQKIKNIVNMPATSDSRMSAKEKMAWLNGRDAVGERTLGLNKDLIRKAINEDIGIKSYDIQNDIIDALVSADLICEVSDE